MPPTSGRNKRTPKVVLDRRIHEIAMMLTAGATRAQVLQTVAKLQDEEARDRARVREHNALYDALSEGAREGHFRLQDVPMAWGDSPIAERTLDRYIELAKGLIAKELEDAIDDRAWLLGKMMARGEQLYAAAFARGKYHACHQVWRTTLQLFKLEETAQLLAPQDEDETQLGGDGKPRLPMVEVVSDGPKLPSETRKRLLEQVAAGAQSELTKPPTPPIKK